jgi:hypothetical protein
VSEAPPALAASVSCSSEGCSTSDEDDAEAALCPVSRTIGLTIDLITVKALLKGSALRRLEGKSYRFCPERDCGIAYFDRERDSIFDKHDLTVRVGQKETEDPITLCYCFDFTVADLRAQGASIPATITAEIKAGHCACEVKNPQGSCCLGNVSRALKRIQSR